MSIGIGLILRENELNEFGIHPSAFTNTFAYNFLHVPAQRHGCETAHNSSLVLKILGLHVGIEHSTGCVATESRYGVLTASYISHIQKKCGLMAGYVLSHHTFIRIFQTPDLSHGHLE